MKSLKCVAIRGLVNCLGCAPEARGSEGDRKTFSLSTGYVRYFYSPLGSVAKKKKKKTKICRHLHVRLSVSMEQLDSHRTDFHKIWYWGFLLKCLHLFEFWLKPKYIRR